MINSLFSLLSSLLFILGYWFISFIQLLILVFLSPKRIRALYSSLDAKEETKRIQALAPFVTKGETILDIGAGSGRFGKAIQENLNVKVSGVDVCDYSDHTIPFFVYDGKKLPFADKSFDTAFFAFVLHHTKEQELILKEACRVAKKQVIIFEDTYENIFERLFTCWNDYHTNFFQGWIKAKKGYFKGDPSQMPMPLTFHSVEEWKNIFKQLPVEVVSTQIRTMGYKPLKKVTFCLKVK